MLIHNFDAVTGQYLSSCLADPDPMNADRWLIPAFSTPDPLPERPQMTWPFRRNDAWILLPDHRGQVLYRQDNGEPTEIMAAGTTPDELRLTDQRRPSDDHVWRNGEWVIDAARIAEKQRAAAMTEFETRMARARDMNRGKADAFAARRLSREEAYYFLAWTDYQLDLVRVIESERFPDVAEWPAEPEPFDVICGPMLSEYDSRIRKARAFLDTHGDAFANGSLSAVDQINYRAWKTYADALERAVDNALGDRQVVWPDEPVPLKNPAHDAPENPERTA
ncbi:tail fiber assembly protein [Burkholderia cenocepacia]|uniref:tail fiber assembly protein n=1 Tax=Burkholderia cenocepacia TaxID=95486 RepID=UPI000F5B002B|nr:tail fiber assembly protein [Burkholderia cenocepacia]MBR8073929.1 tail fiber assembly protein [Burkholderia cenocepacia]MBR8448680.1 tail fiber assembly protein [Burkholderia cenocepacia]MBR8511044.1 tail fiber assembly protein [Burkholderia cenocepacia]RQV53262.1 phage tail protein [Burkholderia cenocepacia]